LPELSECPLCLLPPVLLLISQVVLFHSDMGAGQSKIADPELRHDQAPTTPPAIDPRSSTSDITQGIIISNNNPNTNYMYGSGTIVNNNQIVNQIFHGDLPKISVRCGAVDQIIARS